MNYFSELLESYSKLKKRTYKLTFISEEEKKLADPSTADIQKAESQARSVVNKVYNKYSEGIAANQDDVTFAYKKANTDTVSLVIGGNQRLGGPYEGEESRPFKNLVGHFLKKSGFSDKRPSEGGQDSTDQMKQNAELDAAQAKQQEEQNNRDIDGSLDQHAPQWKESSMAMKKALESIQRYIRDGLIEKRKGQLDYLLFAYGNGNYGGFIRHMVKAKVASFTEGKKGETVVQSERELTPGEFDALANNYSDVLQVHDLVNGSREANEFCAQVDKKIGIMRGKPVIFGGDSSEAVVLPNTNWGLDAAFKKIKSMCFGDSEKDFREALTRGPRGVEGKKPNKARGDVFEVAVAFGLNFLGADTQEEKNEARGFFKSALSSMKDKFDKVIDAFGGAEDAALGLDIFIDKERTQEVKDSFDSKQGATKLLLNEMSKVFGFFKDAAVGKVKSEVTGGGKAAGGLRDDVQISYENEENATKAGENLDAGTGLGPIRPSIKDGVAKLMLGCKRYMDRFSAKSGEVNSRAQMSANMDPDFKGNSNYEAEGMRNRILTEMYGWDGREETKGEALNQWRQAYRQYQEIERENDKLEAALLENSTYMIDGKIAASSPEERAKSMLDSVNASFAYDKMNESALKNYLYDVKNGEVQLKDFSDTPLGRDNRRRLAEIVTRMNRSRRLKKDIEGNNKQRRDNAKRMTVHMMYSTGGNVDDLGQLLGTDTKGSKLINQTGLIRAIAQTDLDDLQVNVDGFTIKLDAGDKKMFKVNQERNTGKKDPNDPESEPSVNTRFAGEIESEVFERHGKNYGKENQKSRQDSSIEILLKGQMRLLEDLLNQTNDNPLL